MQDKHRSAVLQAEKGRNDLLEGRQPGGHGLFRRCSAPNPLERSPVINVGASNLSGGRTVSHADFEAPHDHCTWSDGPGGRVKLYTSGPGAAELRLGKLQPFISVTCSLSRATSWRISVVISARAATSWRMALKSA